MKTDMVFDLIELQQLLARMHSMIIKSNAKETKIIRRLKTRSIRYCYRIFEMVGNQRGYGRYFCAGCFL